MRFILDTHLLLWSAQGSNDAISTAAAALIDDTANQLVFSAASIWEVAIKQGRGVADFTVQAPLLRRLLLDNGYLELPISSDHAAAVATLPNLHKDPFDRLLVAQATFEGITLLTSDRQLAKYPGPIKLV